MHKRVCMIKFLTPFIHYHLLFALHPYQWDVAIKTLFTLVADSIFSLRYKNATICSRSHFSRISFFFYRSITSRPYRDPNTYITSEMVETTSTPFSSFSFKAIVDLVLYFPLFSYLFGFFQDFCIEVMKTGPIPNHVALIMDGNRRYSKAKNLPLKEGHISGAETLLTVWYTYRSYLWYRSHRKMCIRRS